MVSFDAALAGTSAETWAADQRMHDRPQLELEGVDELIVVAAHPDDETLGAAGLIAKCVERGIPSTVIIVTDGAASGQPGIARLREAEARDAAARLGAEVVFLGLPDGATRESRAAVTKLLAPLVAGASGAALVVAPWSGDGHRDHRVVGEVVAELVGSRRFIEYPIWLWHWGTPDDVPWRELRQLPIDSSLKRAALDAYSSQTGGDHPLLRPDFVANFETGVEYFVEHPRSLEVDYFDATYARHDDPWGFETRWYEERKRALTLAILPDEYYENTLEIGCSIGVLTEGLADRTAQLLAVDISQAAVDRAAVRAPSATVERRDVLADFPSGTFDLVVLSEVGYYFDRPGLASVLADITGALSPSGVLVACHWRHPVADYPLDGDTVHRAIGELGLERLASHVEKDFVLEVFSRDGRSVAERTGLA